MSNYRRIAFVAQVRVLQIFLAACFVLVAIVATEARSSPDCWFTGNAAPADLGFTFAGNSEWIETGGAYGQGHFRFTPDDGGSGAIVFPVHTDPVGIPWHDFSVNGRIRWSGLGSGDRLSLNFVAPEDPFLLPDLDTLDQPWEEAPESGVSFELNWNQESCPECLQVRIHEDGDLVSELTLNTPNHIDGGLPLDEDWREFYVAVASNPFGVEQERVLVVSLDAEKLFRPLVYDDVAPMQFVVSGNPNGSDNLDFQIGTLCANGVLADWWVADLDHDERVNHSDFRRLTSNMNISGQAVSLSDGDINFDGRVDLDDFVEFRKIYEQVLQFQDLDMVATPEPSTMSLVVPAILGILLQQRKYSQLCSKAP